jgi:hypothetical protein
VASRVHGLAWDGLAGPHLDGAGLGG